MKHPLADTLVTLAVVIAGIVLANLLLPADDARLLADDPQAAAVPRAAADRMPEQVRQYIKKLDSLRPELVFVGNSTLSVNIDEHALGDLIKLRNTQLADAGAETAWQYLVLKNVILRAARRPKMVCLFFRDELLTQPGYRVRGFHYGRNLKLISLHDEPELERIAYLGDLDPLRYFLYRHVALYRRRDALKARTEDWFKGLAAGATATTTAGLEAAIGRVFADDRLRPGMLAQMQQQVLAANARAGQYDFAELVDRSFLPLMIQLAREGGIQLFFCRIKAKVDARPRVLPPGLPQYLADLRAYLAGRGIPLLDLSGSPAVMEDDYTDADHLNVAGRMRYTRALAEHFLAARETLNGGGSLHALDPRGVFYAWQGRPTFCMDAPAASDRRTFRLRVWCENPGRYTLFCAAPPDTGIDGIRTNGQPAEFRPTADPQPPGAKRPWPDDTFGPIMETEMVVAPPADRFQTIEVRLKGDTGATTPSLAAFLTYRQPKWEPVSESLEVGDLESWHDAAGFHFGAVFHVRRLGYKTHAVNLRLASYPAYKPAADSGAEMFHYHLGRLMQEGDVFWCPGVTIADEDARRLENHPLALTILPSRLPDGGTALTPEPLASPPHLRTPAGERIFRLIKFAQREGALAPMVGEVPGGGAGR